MFHLKQLQSKTYSLNVVWLSLPGNRNIIRFWFNDYSYSNNWIFLIISVKHLKVILRLNFSDLHIWAVWCRRPLIFHESTQAVKAGNIKGWYHQV